MFEGYGTEFLDAIGRRYAAQSRNFSFAQSLHRIPALEGTLPMNTADRFLRFAAECDVMAKFSPSPENKRVWNDLAKRWVRCAQLLEQQGPNDRCLVPLKREPKAKRISVHRVSQVALKRSRSLKVPELARP